MQKVQQILVAYDRSEMSQEALKRAFLLAGDNNAQLIVLHVIEPLFVQSPYAKSIDTKSIEHDIIQEINTFKMGAEVEYMLFIVSGKAAETIILQTKKTQSDLIIVGSHGKNDVQSNYFGSTTLKLIQQTHIPVLIVKNSVSTPYRHMLAPTNLSQYAKESILYANTLFSKPTRKYLYAFETISDLQALTYRFTPEETEELRRTMTLKAAKDLQTFAGEVGEGELELIDYTASVNEDILEYLKNDDADLLVLGSKGMGNLNSFVFSSTASYLLQRSPIDVLIYVPPKTKLD